MELYILAEFKGPNSVVAIGTPLGGQFGRQNTGGLVKAGQAAESHVCDQLQLGGRIHVGVSSSSVGSITDHDGILILHFASGGVAVTGLFGFSSAGTGSFGAGVLGTASYQQRHAHNQCEEQC